MTKQSGIPNQKNLSRRTFLSYGRSSLIATGAELLGAVLGLKLIGDEIRPEPEEKPRANEPEAGLREGIQWHEI